MLRLHGDVVFVPQLLSALRFDRYVVAVNTAKVGEEEVKYTVDGDGYIKELSKQVVEGLGEAVGINYVAPGDRAILAERWIDAPMRTISSEAWRRLSLNRAYAFRPSTSRRSAARRWTLCPT
ncbi:hypothetical protein [Allorhizocola rhizosphaerae]|uniref:hypothetical protein n=1 Tax=Allorhizocola rhizosphaerae TaxID=1872709 RepID=UPI001FEAC72B|nr:hypothetical protein [Allorhizocola rhizosphaerae]